MALKDLISAVRHDKVYEKETLLRTLREFQNAKDQLVSWRNSFEEIMLSHKCRKQIQGTAAPCDVCSIIKSALDTYKNGFMDISDED